MPGLEAFRPASVSRLLNVELLRERLGFNGLIVSDATPMGGFGAWAGRGRDDPRGDRQRLRRDPVRRRAGAGHGRACAGALADGRIPAARLEDALRRILALKAALGLHRAAPPDLAAAREALATPESLAEARAVTARVPTLVKDVQRLLPLDPARHRRVLVYSGGIVHPLAPRGAVRAAGPAGAARASR